MSNTEFTPGPWELSTVQDSRRIYDSKGTHIADASIGKAGVPYYQIKDQEQANANLIAAAPDMYDKLTRLIAGIMQIANDSTTKKSTSSRIYGMISELAPSEAINKANPKP